jgi:trehalose/maltose hydrolase-like predicted phosphorylase
LHALVAARLGDPEMTLRYLREAAVTDLDLDPNSAGGVRIAGLGAMWQAVMHGFSNSYDKRRSPRLHHHLQCAPSST